jgi:protein-tyrosine-phosphatase
MSRANKQTNVLFLCRVNGARSIMAEAITNAFAGSRVRAYSAGIEPIEQIPNAVLSVLWDHGIPIAGLRPKTISEFLGPDACDLDLIVTVGGQTLAELCPSWPRPPVMAHWNIPNTSALTNSSLYHNELVAMYKVIHRCVSALLELPSARSGRRPLARELAGIATRHVPMRLCEGPQASL